MLNVFTGIGIPAILYMQKRQDDDRARLRNEMHDRINHLDACLDEVKERVLSATATRSEVLAVKADVMEIITRARAAISAETHGLHERVLRLEDINMRRHDG